MHNDAELTVKEKVTGEPVLPGISTKWFIFYFIWPFASLIAALRKFREPYAKTIFWLFCVYFGFVFVYDYIAPGKVTADSAYYAEELVKMHENKITFYELTDKFYKDKGEIDVYQPLITWMISLFSGDPRVLFTVFAAIFGFFYTQNLWLIYNRVTKDINWLLLLLMIYYALINPVWNINGVRMWTAASIFLYGNLVYILNGKKTGLLWIAISSLVHFSFLFLILISFIFLIIPKNINGLFIFFIVTSFIGEIDINFVRGIMSRYLPVIFQPRIESYLGNDYLQIVTESNQGLSGVVRLNNLATKLVIYSWILITFFYLKKQIVFKQEILKIFSLALFLGGFVNLISLLPSGGRFFVISNSLFCATFILMLSVNKINFLKFLQLCTFPLILYLIVFSLRIGFNYMGILTFFGNPILSVFVNDQTPLINFIKQLY